MNYFDIYLMKHPSLLDLDHFGVALNVVVILFLAKCKPFEHKNSCYTYAM